MSHDSQSLDIDSVPGLAEIVEGVQRTGRPRVLCRDSEAIAVLVPVSAEWTSPVDAPFADVSVDADDRDNPVARTAGILRAYRLPHPVSPEEEQARTEWLIAQDVVERMGR